MKVLAFDCATGPTSVALWRDGTVAARADDARPQGQAESLVPLIGLVLQQAGLAPAGVDRIAVTLGPGSFTGVRIALAAARGLGLAVGRPVFGRSSLEVMAAGLPPAECPTLVAIDARRGEIYGQLFAPDGRPLSVLAAVALPEIGAAGLLPAGPLRVAGSGAALVAGASGRTDLDLAAVAAPDAAVLARLVAGAAAADADPAPEPIYLRAPDARLPAA
ncbi:tRNA (adenosine(37)-N6)-threonylcarbamoyltransferase complex dimerization subunit type 1 TsaB [Zavarzinia compransoris]|uniref:tRNA (Adenosine(37)-N6)-threonylcarbamoyltransferase complex dimerization subunit type 1 TsaB n=1 Tax=Zavarzinia compransoris TaxID=1264899 RepID=A0A317E670_9PROT|nr:tRNA (adenosine(37)-N6)-threonylcarbamoyltransferase complex dimerization subunit type 1 TsaB [Zavarzinia compransoris]PWR20883.1 tRNA (adenosine(37)-N6)-threonylcarbamoyltransferase complex dimerization subunit type 1 TsaB [Zavarzinia compransoris]TDP44281.1 tRNA threonylcarbamoyladenosine biosynthesis protein TsaB [Zavarzinia compransoris]